MLEEWLRIKTQHLKRQVAVETHTLLNIWFKWELFVLKMSVNMIVELKTMESVEMFKNHEMSFITNFLTHLTLFLYFLTDNIWLNMIQPEK